MFKSIVNEEGWGGVGWWWLRFNLTEKTERERETERDRDRKRENGRLLLLLLRSPCTQEETRM
jgi:hypothetical protein